MHLNQTNRLLKSKQFENMKDKPMSNHSWMLFREITEMMSNTLTTISDRVSHKCRRSRLHAGYGYIQLNYKPIQMSTTLGWAFKLIR